MDSSDFPQRRAHLATPRALAHAHGAPARRQDGSRNAFVGRPRRASPFLAVLLGVAGQATAIEIAGVGTGPIPDGPNTGGDVVCNASSQGTPLVVEFRVSGMTTLLHHVGVRITFAPAHTHVGDLHARLAAPGGAPTATVFGDTGQDIVGDDGSDVEGQYQFADDGPLDWWAAAASAPQDGTMAPGFYRATADGSAQPVSLDAAFGGLRPDQINGTWTLEVTDDCEQATGGVAFAALVLNATLPVELQAFDVE